jgi:hypothetical protein
MKNLRSFCLLLLAAPFINPVFATDQYNLPLYNILLPIDATESVQYSVTFCTDNDLECNHGSPSSTDSVFTTACLPLSTILWGRAMAGRMLLMNEVDIYSLAMQAKPTLQPTDLKNINAYMVTDLMDPKNFIIQRGLNCIPSNTDPYQGVCHPYSGNTPIPVYSTNNIYLTGGSTCQPSISSKPSMENPYPGFN